MTGVELRHGAATDVGRVREVNEDAYLTAPPVFVVADGMGGHLGGDVASRIVVEQFARLSGGVYEPRGGVEAIEATLHECQAQIAAYDLSENHVGDPRLAAGTTVAAALLVETRAGSSWLVANLGDSRIYRCDQGSLEQVSVDHSVVQELVDAGAITAGEATTHPERHVVTRALGGRGGASADFFELPLAGAERLLLCSDGVSEMLDDPTIARILAESADPRDAADRLVGAAVAAGGRDNATAVVIDVVGLAPDLTPDVRAERVSLEQKLGALP